MNEATTTENNLDVDAFRNGFKKRKNDYQALVDETGFILNNEIERRGIKIHALESRVKSEDSIIKKMR